MANIQVFTRHRTMHKGRRSAFAIYLFSALFLFLHFASILVHFFVSPTHLHMPLSICAGDFRTCFSEAKGRSKLKS